MGKYQFSYEEKITIIREHEGSHKTLKAICEEYDISKNAKPSEGLILHSDNGFQYTSQAYYNVAKANGIKPSMSSVGCPYDNACAENFFSMLKTECISEQSRKPLTKPKNLWMNIFILTTMSEYSSRQDKPQWKSVMLIPHNRCPQKMSTDRGRVTTKSVFWDTRCDMIFIVDSLSEVRIY